MSVRIHSSYQYSNVWEQSKYTGFSSTTLCDSMLSCCSQKLVIYLFPYHECGTCSVFRHNWSVPSAPSWPRWRESWRDRHDKRLYRGHEVQGKLTSFWASSCQLHWDLLHVSCCSLLLPCWVAANCKESLQLWLDSCTADQWEDEGAWRTTFVTGCDLKVHSILCRVVQSCICTLASLINSNYRCEDLFHCCSAYYASICSSQPGIQGCHIKQRQTFLPCRPASCTWTLSARRSVCPCCLTSSIWRYPRPCL